MRGVLGALAALGCAFGRRTGRPVPRGPAEGRAPGAPRLPTQGRFTPGRERCKPSAVRGTYRCEARGTGRRVRGEGQGTCGSGARGAGAGCGRAGQGAGRGTRGSGCRARDVGAGCGTRGSWCRARGAGRAGPGSAVRARGAGRAGPAQGAGRTRRKGQGGAARLLAARGEQGRAGRPLPPAPARLLRAEQLGGPRRSLLMDAPGTPGRPALRGAP